MHSSSEPAAPIDSLAGRRALVLVLGDVGRSPRMRYHALALADAGAEVDLVGQAGAPIGEELEQHPRVATHLLPSRETTHTSRSRVGALLSAAARSSADSARLLRLAASLPQSDFVLVQIPPAFPAALVAMLAPRLRRARLVLDWHNLSASQLALSFGEDHLAVRALDRFERSLMKRADATICVSRAMAAHLRQLGARDPVVLYDRPAPLFTPTPADQRRVLLERLAGELDLPLLARAGDDRPALLVSSTSWSADEDFTPLVEALARLGREAGPPLHVLITGRGPQRSSWESLLRAVESERVRVRTLWLEAPDHARLLGAADLGLCLHRSSSGLDLPMKIADMFGAGLPVCALDYGPCLAEILVRDGNGLLFRDGEELALQITSLLEGFPQEGARLEHLRNGALRSAKVRWPAAWREAVLPIFARAENH